MEPEVATSCNEMGIPVKGEGQQPTHKTFDPKFVLPTRSVVIKMEQRFREWPTSDWPNLKPTPWERVNP